MSNGALAKPVSASVSTSSSGSDIALSYDINGQRCTAPAFYALACNPAQSVSIEACAGAGKTWMLVSRIVRALYAGARPQEVLAITFTNKATAEMQQRLTEWLQTFASPHTPDEALDQALSERGVALAAEPAARQAQRLRLRGLYAQLLAQPHGVQFRTFHGWFASWLAQCPLALLASLGLPTQYELLLDPAAAQDAAWQPFFARLHANAHGLADYEYAVQHLGQHLTHQVLRTALGKRQELETQGGEGARPTDSPTTRPTVPDFDVQNPALNGHASPLAWLTSAGVQAELQTCAAQLGTCTSVALVELAQGLEAACTAWRGSKENAGSHAAGFEGAGSQDPAAVFEAAFVAAVATGSGEPRRFGRIKKDELATGGAVAERVLDIYRAFKAAKIQQRAHRLQGVLQRLSKVLMGVYAAHKREHSLLDMDDVERVAERLMSHPSTALWLAQRLDQRVKYLLVDEFQDTSPLQWRTLTAWLDNYAGAAHKPSVLLVGDPKQSIYRFRRADPRVFAAAQWRLQQAFDAPLLRCSHTRRNAPGVLQPLNAVFSQAAAAKAFGNYLEHTTSSTAVGGVWALPLVLRPRKGDGSDTHDAVVAIDPAVPSPHVQQQQAEQAADWLAAQLRQGWQPHQIMVLARTRKPLNRLAHVLAQRGIAAEFSTRQTLLSSLAVTDMLALCDAALAPNHHLALTQTLKSPLFGWNDTQLLHLKAVADADHAGSWWQALALSVDVPYIQAAHQALQRCQDWLHQLPVHDALQRVYAQLEVLLRYQASAGSPEAQRSVTSSLEALLAQTLDFAGGRSTSAYVWLRELRRQEAVQAEQTPATGEQPQGNSSEDVGENIGESTDEKPQTEHTVAAHSIALHTIHTAKGLEADVVLYYDTYPERRSRAPAQVLLGTPLSPADLHESFNDDTFENLDGTQAAPQGLNFVVGEAAPSQLPWLAREAAAQAREDLNTLYVAMTRARQHLVLSAAQPHKPSLDCAWLRLASHAQPLAANDVLPQGKNGEVGNEVGGVAGGVANSVVLSSEPPTTSAAGTQAAETNALSSNAAGSRTASEASVFWRLPHSTLSLTKRGAGVAPNEPAAEPTAGAATDATTDHTELRTATNPSLIAPLSPAQRLGLALHRVLQRLPLDPSSADLNALLPAAQAEFGLSAANTAQLQKAAQHIVWGEHAWLWDSQRIDWHAAELPLADAQGPLRLDRVVHETATQTWWIIDFKLAAQPQNPTIQTQYSERYTAQLARYAAAWQHTVGPQGRVKTLLLGGAPG